MPQNLLNSLPSAKTVQSLPGRFRFVSALSALSGIAGILAGLFELQNRSWFIGALDFSASLGLLLVGVVSYRWEFLRRFAGGALVVVGTLLLLISFVTGGLDNSSAAWLGLVPVVSVFVYGWKPALLLTGFYIVYMFLAFFSFTDLIQAGPAYTLPAVRQIVIAVITYYLATAYFDWQLSRSQSQLSAQLQEAATLNQKLALENVQEEKLRVRLEESLKNLEKKNQSAQDIRRAMLNLLEDIEQEKENSAKISERLSLATESAKIGVWEYNLKTQELIWDKNMRVIYGLSDSEPVDNQLWSSFYKPEVWQRRQKLFQEAVESKGEYSTILPFTRRDGSARYVSGHGLVQKTKDGEPSRVIGVNMDVTREQEIDKAKSEFVSLASHQLRTPLTSMGWYAEMLLAGDAGRLNPGQKEYIEEIYKGNKRMVELVNALLNVSRLEMGTFMIEPELADLVTLAKDAVKEQKPQMEAKLQTFTEDYGKSSLKFPVDVKLFRMVIQNLLSNAIKYTPEKGKITLGIKLLGQMPEKFKDFGRAEDVLVYVADNGMGIPKAQQGSIFMKLFRADNAKISVTEGTGLGLYIVKTIVERSGGRVWFESAENRGSTFYTLIPKQGMKAKKGSKALT
jgi:PAS domain S-box-containing protein